ncbi:hypothetical protein L1887_30732 [Cichorium endivia]|nr:hypothetical protein L1887_30732 [Cichorium endivia]
MLRSRERTQYIYIQILHTYTNLSRIFSQTTYNLLPSFKLSVLPEISHHSPLFLQDQTATDPCFTSISLLGLNLLFPNHLLSLY